MTHRIFITGGNGFIGQYVQRRLDELQIPNTSYDPTLDIRDDVLDYHRLAEAVNDFDPTAIIHLAGMLGTHELWDATDAAIDVNIKGALNVGRVALAHEAKLVSIEQPHIWYNVYEATKLAARRMLTGMHYDRGLKVEYVTAHNAFGPGQHYGDGHPQKIIPTFATKAWLGEPIPIWGDGSQMVNLVYAGDVARLLVERALMSGTYPEQDFHAGVNELLSVNVVAGWVNQIVQMEGYAGGKLEYLDARLGEQNNFKYPYPDDIAYPFRFRFTDLAATVLSYQPLPY